MQVGRTINWTFKYAFFAVIKFATTHKIYTQRNHKEEEQKQYEIGEK